MTPKTSTPACTGGPTSSRAGVTIVFSGLPDAWRRHARRNGRRRGHAHGLDDGLRLDDDDHLSQTTTVTNLSYTDAAGNKLVIPSMTGTGTLTYPFGQTPPTAALNFSGELQILTSGGTMTADHNFVGTATFSFGGSATGYTVDGGITVVDNLAAGAGTSITVTGLKRVTSCCRPVGGSIDILQTSGAGPGTHSWTFGSTCGTATVDGNSTTLPACI